MCNQYSSNFTVGSPGGFCKRGGQAWYLTWISTSNQPTTLWSLYYASPYVGITGVDNPNALICYRITHKLHDQVDPTTTFTIEMLMTSLKHASSPRVRLPITLNILKKVIGNISELYRSRYQRVNGVAIAKHNRHTLEFADVKCRNKYVVISFRTFKYSKGQTASLKIAATHDVCCPVSALSKYLSKRGTVSGPFS